MKIVRRTMAAMAVTMGVLNLLLIAVVSYLMFLLGSAEGYSLGKKRMEMDNPFKLYVESGRAFCYENGAAYYVIRTRWGFKYEK